MVGEGIPLTTTSLTNPEGRLIEARTGVGVGPEARLTIKISVIHSEVKKGFLRIKERRSIITSDCRISVGDKIQC